MADSRRYCVREWYNGEVVHVYGGLSRREAKQLRKDRMKILVQSLGVSEADASEALELMEERMLHRMEMEKWNERNH